MDLHGSGVGIIENGASRLWLKDGCVGAGGVNPSLVCFRSMYWLDASTRAAHLDPSMDVEKPRHANTQQHVSGPRTLDDVYCNNRGAISRPPTSAPVIVEISQVTGKQSMPTLLLITRLGFCWTFGHRCIELLRRRGGQSE